MKEVFYYSDILGVLIISIRDNDRVFLQNDPSYFGIRTVTKEQALKYIINSHYELIGYL